MSRLKYTILILLFGILMIAGSGYFEPAVTSSSIDEQSSDNSNHNKTDNNINNNGPVIEEPNQKDNQNNNQYSGNSNTSSNETDKPDLEEQNNYENNSDSTEPSNENDKPNYRIEVSISEQRVRIYDNDTLIKNWTVSTGENNSTPRGDFTIQNRGEWFFSEKYQEGAMWWVSFKDWGIYLFHSVPMDRQRNIIQEEADKLGTPASHGCIRLKVEDAKWIYDNIPAGTPIHIE